MAISGTVAPMPMFTAFDPTSGVPLAGGKVFTYAAGTSTPLATYSDAGLAVANTNPVILNASGQASIFLGSQTAYKFILQTASGVVVWTQDNVLAVPPAAGTPGAHHASHETGGADALTTIDAGIVKTGTLPVGQLPAAVARTDVANTFTAVQRMDMAVPRLYWNDSLQAANLRLFDMNVNAQTFVINPVTDAGAMSASGLALNRSGDLSVGHDFYEKGRTTPMGHWINQPFNAAHYYADSPTTWTVVAGNVGLNSYTLVGRTLIWTVVVSGSVLGGSPGGAIYVLLPGGFNSSSPGNAGANRCAFMAEGGGAYRGDAYVALWTSTAVRIVPGTATGFALGSSVGVQFTLAIQL